MMLIVGAGGSGLLHTMITIQMMIVVGGGVDQIPAVMNIRAHYRYVQKEPCIEKSNRPYWRRERW